MSEKVKCPRCKGEKQILDPNGRTAGDCPVCHGTGFAPAPPDEGIREKSILTDMDLNQFWKFPLFDYPTRFTHDKKSPEFYLTVSKNIAKAQAALTASHYTEKQEQWQADFTEKMATKYEERVHQAEQETARLKKLSYDKLVELFRLIEYDIQCGISLSESDGDYKAHYLKTRDWVEATKTRILESESKYQGVGK